MSNNYRFYVEAMTGDAVAKLNERSVERLGLVLQTRSNPKLQGCVYLSM